MSNLRVWLPGLQQWPLTLELQGWHVAQGQHQGTAALASRKLKDTSSFWWRETQVLGLQLSGGQLTALGWLGHQAAQGRGCAKELVVGQTAGLNTDSEGYQTWWPTGVILTKHPEEWASRKLPNIYSVTAPSDTAEIAWCP